jgi:hypothetical protein
VRQPWELRASRDLMQRSAQARKLQGLDDGHGELGTGERWGGESSAGRQEEDRARRLGDRAPGRSNSRGRIVIALLILTACAS